jgi:hypothetical protein
MFHFPTFPPHTLFHSGAGTRKQLRVGSPIRTPSDHSPFAGSPRLIAGYHVLHRLSMPRHPPYAHKNLTTHPVPLKNPGCISSKTIIIQNTTKMFHKNQKHNKNKDNTKPPTQPKLVNESKPSQSHHVINLQFLMLASTIQKSTNKTNPHKHDPTRPHPQRQLRNTKCLGFQ